MPCRHRAARGRRRHHPAVSGTPAIGMLHQAFAAMETAQPYGIGAYFAYRHDPLTGMPDAEAMKRALDKLKLLVSIDVRYSETGWYSDVILPESTYLERANILRRHARPGPGVRHARPGDRAALRQPPGLVDLPRDPAPHGHQGSARLRDHRGDSGTTSSRAPASPSPRCARQGFVSLADAPKLTPRDKLRFPTPSGKIEIESEVLKKAGLPSLPPYEPKAAPTGDSLHPAVRQDRDAGARPVAQQPDPQRDRAGTGALDPPRPGQAAGHRRRRRGRDQRRRQLRRNDQGQGDALDPSRRRSSCCTATAPRCRSPRAPSASAWPTSACSTASSTTSTRPAAAVP
ncbi:MAG: molybdopterin-dependent oxidoreductase [Chromatiales bacterium]|nr:molybdopterin-dependent oxidoreductase [Chromatiales bacterium]